MAFSVMQVGTALKLMDNAGNVSALTLPSGITLDDTKAPRWAIFNNYVVLTNTPSRPLTIDSKGVVRPLCLLPPSEAAVLTTAVGGALTGTYLEKNSFLVLDENGNIIAESDLSPASNSEPVASAYLRATNVPVSLDTISARRLYRTTNAGAVYFQWVDIDGNLVTAVQDDLSDAGLGLVAQPVLGTCPHLVLIAEWRGRLWGVSDQDPDTLHYSESGIMYAWPSVNNLIVPPKGVDTTGVTALMPRREALGCGRKNQLIQITGQANQTLAGLIDLAPVILSREVGVLAQDSCALYRDQWYFLWYDGVYRWGTDGIVCISDGQKDQFGHPTGKGQVRSWFTSDFYFNRARFPFAFGFIDPIRYKYVLFLADPTSNVENRWVEYDLNDGTWWGPHKSDKFNPSAAFNVLNSSNVLIPLVGSTVGDVFKQQDTRTDSSVTPIAFDAAGKRHDMEDPDRDKYFGEMSVYGQAQLAGTLTVQGVVGEFNATTPNLLSYDMTKSRQRLGRLGVGKSAQIEFINAEVGQDVALWGYAIDPVILVGRR